MSAASGARTLLTLGLDVVAPLAVFYGARALGLDPWLALVLGVLAPAGAIALTWARDRHLDTTAVFVIAAMALSLVIALFTGDPRALLARESWVTGAIGAWMLVSMALRRPFLLDIAIKISPPGTAARYDALWTGDPVFHRWMVGACWAWGLAFVLDAAGRVVMAYTLPVDSVPLLGVLLLVALLVIAQGGVLLHGWRSGALRLLRG
ncbi:VC0807 family protein [Actinokineospora bangkokensis]|uniref:DUF3159 domain-containing protein n=1 Tax=Actinokineospora bangkokensis TaxID=1193682 RepID=A0A1Q9LDG5_9PSEU|nr:VC0807 family protein [Actinokineospora bangkokensis]OLR90053.1 hypothetical protein BJP25_03490 [Actinokineospora bangkokensis]